MDSGHIALLIGIGFVGGVWNAIAGGATLFTFPALMAVGLSPVVANATNYLALLPSNAAALPAYWPELRQLGRRLVPLLLISSGGAITGSILLLISTSDLFVTLVPFLILGATALFALGDALRRRLLSFAGQTRGTGLIYAALFLASIYGGYFGAGLGVVLLAIAQILGYSDFHQANSIKNLLAASFTALSILIFGAGGLIAWPEAATMMVGSSLGGYFGGRYARRVNQNILRALVIIFGLILSAVYFVRTFGG